MPPRGTSRSPGRGGRTSQLAPAIQVVHSARGSRAGAGSGVHATRNSPNTALPRSPVGTTSTAAYRTARFTRNRANATSAIQPSPRDSRRPEGRRGNSTSWRARRTPSTRPLRRAAARIFFFQAEDGIRDLTVTGVQTCALPIFTGVEDVFSGERNFFVAYGNSPDPGELARDLGQRYEIMNADIKRWAVGSPIQAEIGRASCRERV